MGVGATGVGVGVGASVGAGAGVGVGVDACVVDGVAVDVGVSDDVDAPPDVASTAVLVCVSVAASDVAGVSSTRCSMDSFWML